MKIEDKIKLAEVIEGAPLDNDIRPHFHNGRKGVTYIDEWFPESDVYDLLELLNYLPMNQPEKVDTWLQENTSYGNINLQDTTMISLIIWYFTNAKDVCMAILEVYKEETNDK